MAKVQGKQIADGAITSTQAETATGTISTINGGDAAVGGTSAGLSNRDHQHAVATAAAGAIAIGDAAAEGGSSDLARADHVHSLAAPAAPADTDKSAASAGASSAPARADHKHDVSTAAPIAVGAALLEGTSTDLARADHQHTHGNQAGGALHADATTGTAGFMSAADKLKLDAMQDAAGIDAKESVRVRTQADDTLSGLAVRDGITPLVGDRVLVDQQTTTSEDGIYIAAAGAWARAADMATGTEARGSIVHVEEGTADADKLFQCTNNAAGDVVGTDGLTFSQIGSGSPRGAGAGLVLNGNDIDAVATDASIVVSAGSIGVGVLQTDGMHGVRGGGTQHAEAIASGASGFMSGADKAKLDGVGAGAEANLTDQQEAVTTQNITGADTVLTAVLSAVPDSNASVSLYLNKLLQQQGAGFDYTISGTAITWLASSGSAVDLETTDSLVAVYKS